MLLGPTWPGDRTGTSSRGCAVPRQRLCAGPSTAPILPSTCRPMAARRARRPGRRYGRIVTGSLSHAPATGGRPSGSLDPRARRSSAPTRPAAARSRTGRRLARHKLVLLDRSVWPTEGGSRRGVAMLDLSSLLRSQHVCPSGFSSESFVCTWRGTTALRGAWTHWPTDRREQPHQRSRPGKGRAAWCSETDSRPGSDHRIGLPHQRRRKR
jgi:hypothetical protein